MKFANLFGSNADVVTPADRVAGIDRAIGGLHEQRAQLLVDRERAHAAMAEADAARRAVVVGALVEHDGDAQARLDSFNAQRRQHEDVVRDIDEAIVQIDARLLALDVEHVEAKRAQTVDCVSQLVSAQRERGRTIDAALAAVVPDICRWVEEDAIVAQHGRDLGLHPGRAIESRLQDALSAALYGVLPRALQLGAIDISLNVTSARRGGTFESLSAIHGPAGSVAAKPATSEEA